VVDLNTERLNSLYASDCAISLIPDFAFRRNAALQTIDLSSNSISSLTQRSMYGLAGSLAVINFNDNSITTIHQCTFYSFRYLSFFTTTLPCRVTVMSGFHQEQDVERVFPSHFVHAAEFAL